MLQFEINNLLVIKFCWDLRLEYALFIRLFSCLGGCDRGGPGWRECPYPWVCQPPHAARANGVPRQESPHHGNALSLSVVLWTHDSVNFMNTASFRCLECVSSVFHYYLMYMGTKIAKFWILFHFLFLKKFLNQFLYLFLASCVWICFTLITIVYFDIEVKFLPFGYFL